MIRRDQAAVVSRYRSGTVAAAGAAKVVRASSRSAAREQQRCQSGRPLVGRCQAAISLSMAGDEAVFTQDAQRYRCVEPFKDAILSSFDWSEKPQAGQWSMSSRASACRSMSPRSIRSSRVIEAPTPGDTSNES